MLILNGLISQDAEDEATEMLDIVAAGSDTLAEAEDAVFLQEVLSLLTEKQQKVITATVLKGATEKEVARKLRMSQPAVHQIKERALNSLKKHFVLDEPTAK